MSPLMRQRMLFSGSNLSTTTNSSPGFGAGAGSCPVNQSGWAGTAPETNYFEFAPTPASRWSVALTKISLGSDSPSTGRTLTASARAAIHSPETWLPVPSINDGNWYAKGVQTVSPTFTAPITFRLRASGAFSPRRNPSNRRFHGEERTVRSGPEPATFEAARGIASLLGDVARCKIKKPGQR